MKRIAWICTLFAVLIGLVTGCNTTEPNHDGGMPDDGTVGGVAETMDEQNAAGNETDDEIPGGENDDTEDVHAHDYKDKWTYDNANHWHECKNTDCTTVTELGAHTWDSENTCTVCAKYKDRLEFTLENGTYTVTDCWPMEGVSEIIIPSTYNGIAVTKIGKEAFRYDSMTSIVIPSTVTEIGFKAFENCSNLMSVTIPGSVTVIGGEAFKGCERLTTVTIEDAAVRIENHAFYGCSRLANISLGNNITSINGGLSTSPFYGTKYYDSLANWENGVLYIGNCLIKAETSLSGDYTVKEGTQVIAESAFSGCSGLTSVTIPSSVTCIDQYTFQKSGITSITIPEGVTEIDENAFSECASLKTVTIPDSVTSIGRNAFYNCKRLNEMNIGNGVTSMGVNAFVNAPCGKWENDVFYIGNYLIAASESIQGTCTVREGTLGIADNAFSGCARLMEISLPDSVKSIGGSAFAGCSNLASVTIPSGVVRIGRDAFSGCACLTSVTIPDLVTSIERGTFSDCTSLTSVTIGTNVKAIGYSAFSGCYSLTSIHLLDSVEVIESYAFKGCEALEKVEGTENVTVIGDSAFYGCMVLQSVSPLTNVQSIGANAFKQCEKLSALRISDNVQSIDFGAFEGTAFWADASNWDNGVLYVGKHVIGAQGTISGNYVIRDGTVSIGPSAFRNCAGLTSVVIPESVKFIGASAFEGCKGLTSVVVPDSVESIGESAFSECTGLTSMTLPFTGKSRVASDYESHFGYIFGFTRSTYEPDDYDYGTYKEYYTYHIPIGLKRVVITDDVQIEFRGASDIVSITVPANTEFLYISRCFDLDTVYYRGFKGSWDGIYVLDEYDLLSYTVHCIDGDIKK